MRIAAYPNSLDIVGHFPISSHNENRRAFPRANCIVQVFIADDFAKAHSAM